MTMPSHSSQRTGAYCGFRYTMVAGPVTMERIIAVVPRQCGVIGQNGPDNLTPGAWRNLPLDRKRLNSSNIWSGTVIALYKQ